MYVGVRCRCLVHVLGVLSVSTVLCSARVGGLTRNPARTTLSTLLAPVTAHRHNEACV